MGSKREGVFAMRGLDDTEEAADSLERQGVGSRRRAGAPDLRRSFRGGLKAQKSIGDSVADLSFLVSGAL